MSRPSRYMPVNLVMIIENHTPANSDVWDKLVRKAQSEADWTQTNRAICSSSSGLWTCNAHVALRLHEDVICLIAVPNPREDWPHG